MSKKRPRAAAGSNAAATSTGTRLQPWTRRVFRNSYTYRGRLLKVKGWSVKIQHEGQRRTLSLNAARRADAAREAAELYQKIVSEGWPSVAPPYSRKTPRAPGSPENARRIDEDSPDRSKHYWQQRLLQRPYPKPADPALPPQWTVRIEHQGVGAYFPLGTPDRKVAAAKAFAIYRSVIEEGWDVAFEKSPREITLGIQWALNPVVWSYTTFHTEMARQSSRSAREDQHALRVVIVEADGGIRRALQRWIDSQPGVACVAAYASAGDVFRRASPGRKELWLLNRTLPDGQGSHCLERLRRLAPDLGGVIYSVYEDSNQLFLATPGGALAYHLIRTPPERLLEPVTTGQPAALSPGEILARVRKYFQISLTAASSSEEAGVLENLTPREHEILRLLSKGHVDKEIAARLGISGWTVHGHVKHIFEKLNVHTRTEAVVKLLQK